MRVYVDSSIVLRHILNADRRLGRPVLRTSSAQAISLSSSVTGVHSVSAWLVT